MLAADKAHLDASLMQQRTQILYKELDLFASQLSTIASISTFLASMSWAGLMLGPPQLTLHAYYHGVIIRIYYYLASSAMGTNLFTVATASFVLVWGPQKACRGTDGAMEEAIADVRRVRASRS